MQRIEGQWSSVLNVATICHGDRKQARVKIAEENRSDALAQRDEGAEAGSILNDDLNGNGVNHRSQERTMGMDQLLQASREHSHEQLVLWPCRIDQFVL